MPALLLLSGPGQPNSSWPKIPHVRTPSQQHTQPQGSFILTQYQYLQMVLPFSSSGEKSKNGLFLSQCASPQFGLSSDLSPNDSSKLPHREVKAVHITIHRTTEQTKRAIRQACGLRALPRPFQYHLLLAQQQPQFLRGNHQTR